MRPSVHWYPWVALLAVPALCAAGERRPKLADELRRLQASAGLSLLAVDRGAVWQLDFRTGRLRELVKLPPELAGFPGPGWHLENNSLDWPHRKLAGTGDHGLFVADLAAGKVRWYLNILVSQRMSLSHQADHVAFQSYGTVDVLDLTTGKTTEVAAGMNESTTPRWSGDDTRLVFHSDQWEVVIADLATGQRRVLAKGNYPTWLPGSNNVTLRRDFGYLHLSAAGGEGKKVMGADEVAELLGYSPDGRFAVYQRGWRWDINIKGYEYGEVAVVRLADGKQTGV
jgi:hypothetical protein